MISTTDSARYRRGSASKDTRKPALVRMMWRICLINLLMPCEQLNKNNMQLFGKTVDFSLSKKRILNTLKKLRVKDYLLALAITFFIALPIMVSFLEIIPSDKISRVMSKVRSIINIDTILVIAPLCSLILSNYQKSQSEDRFVDIENRIKEFSAVILILTLAIFTVMSVLFSTVPILFWNYAFSTKATIHIVIFIVCLYYILAIDDLMKDLLDKPNKLYALLWSILLISYILYRVIFKWLDFK